MLRLLIIILLAVAVSAFAADGDQPRVQLYRGGAKELTPQSKTKVVAWSETFLKSANFNTANHPEILKQSVADIQERYRQTVRQDYVVVSYDRPVAFTTVGGDVTVMEIVVGLNRDDEFASGLFTIDPQGRVIAHEKYAALPLPAELSPTATTRGAR